MNIVQAIKDRNLFKPYLAVDGSISSWSRWLTCLRVIYGLPLKHDWQKRLVKQCTGRDPNKLNPKGYDRVLLLCGRRSGKSKIGGLVGAFEASLSGREKSLSRGERGLVTITSPTKDQSQIIRNYCRAALATPLLDDQVEDEAKKRPAFTLHNGVEIRTLVGDFRSVRGYSQLAVLVDEIAFFGLSEESKVKSDSELIRAITPSLLTTHGRLICVSSKYWMKGWAYATWKKHFGNDSSRILVWDAASRLMNPTLSQADIDAEIADDPAAARAEFLSLWREDIEDYLPRSAVEAIVVKGRTQLVPRSGIQYTSFTDVSGGRRDPFALAVGHRDKGKGKVVLDYIRQWKPPCSPLIVIGEMANVLKRYHLQRTSGDAYAAQFTTDAFRNNGIVYAKSEKNKSQLYLELIGPVCACKVELLDNESLITQISSLQRHTRAGGRDSVDHPGGGHDDLANVLAGVVVGASRGTLPIGFGFDIFGLNDSTNVQRNRTLMGRAIASQRQKQTSTY